MRDNNSCQLCRSNDWVTLPDPSTNKSVTTASRVVDQPLGKSQCNNCGFVQRVRATFLGFTDYYENDYANYYERPNTTEFHKKRYEQIINFMLYNVNTNQDFKEILDIGCGQGWAMDEVRAKYPDSTIEGAEPSDYNVKKAEVKGYKIYHGKLEDIHFEKKYDMIYSNNVIQHVNDAKAFMENSKKLLKEGGILIVTCPDGSRPNIELLWSDQNYSFLPQHLVDLGNQLNFEHTFHSLSGNFPALPPAQSLTLTNNFDNLRPSIKKEDNTVLKEDVLQLREEYLSAFSKIDDYLISNIEEGMPLYNLGASYWTSALATYCPKYWDKVESCLIDETDNHVQFMGKTVQKIQDIDAANSAITLGISPASHDAVANKFSNWAKVLKWNNFIKY